MDRLGSCTAHQQPRGRHLRATKPWGCSIVGNASRPSPSRDCASFINSLATGGLTGSLLSTGHFDKLLLREVCEENRPAGEGNGAEAKPGGDGRLGRIATPGFQFTPVRPGLRFVSPQPLPALLRPSLLFVLTLDFQKLYQNVRSWQGRQGTRQGRRQEAPQGPSRQHPGHHCELKSISGRVHSYCKLSQAR